MLDFERFYSLLQLVLAWPVLIGIAILYLVRRFDKEIRYLLLNLKSVEAAGVKAEIQKKPTEEKPKRVDGEPPPDGTKLVKDSEYWEFMYLNDFLVFTSKQLLRYLYVFKAASSLELATFFNNWNTLIEQRVVITEVLKYYSLIETDSEERAVITPKGVRFLSYIRFIHSPEQ